MDSTQGFSVLSPYVGCRGFFAALRMTGVGYFSSGHPDEVRTPGSQSMDSTQGFSVPSPHIGCRENMGTVLSVIFPDTPLYPANPARDAHFQLLDVSGYLSRSFSPVLGEVTPPESAPTPK